MGKRIGRFSRRDGVGILTEHGGAVEVRAIPTREPNGELRIEAPSTEGIRKAYETKKFLSVEFRAENEFLTRGGIREIRRGMISAAAMVTSPEFDHATVEVRRKKPGLVFWL